MNIVDTIMAELLAGASALGAWLIGPKGDVISGAVTEPSIKPPMMVMIAGTTFIDLGDRQLYAEPLGKTQTTLVLLFDNRPSLGLIRLRLRQAEKAIRQELYRGVGS
jgi:hypothetical protein